MTYENTRAHLLDELDRVQSLLDAYAATTETVPAGDDPAAAAEIELAHNPARLSLQLPAERADQLAERADRIDDRCAETPAEVPLRVRILADRFDLSRAHLDVLLLALAPDIESEYQAVFDQLHDVPISHPTVGMIADLFSRTTEQQLAATALVGPSSPLRQHGFIRLAESDGDSNSHQHRLVTVDQRLLSYLQGHLDIDSALEPFANLETPSTALDDLRLDDGVRERVETLADREDAPGRHYFHGPEGSQTHRAVEALSDDRLLRGDLTAVLEADALDRLHREALLQDCPVHVTGADAAFDRESARTLEDVFDRFTDLPTDLYVTGAEPWTPTGTTLDLDAIVEFPRPSIELRREFWTDHAEDLPADLDPTVLASTFELTQGQLEAALSTARSLADGEFTAADVRAGCRAQSADGLDELAQQIDPTSTWDDIHLRETAARELRMVREHIARRARVYSEWGFEEQFSRGTGVVALFKGSSGTGKTMAAEVLANDVGMEIYKIDLSSVVSKYIGETEENLEAIFQAAEQSNSILLFDEADSIFGDRAEVSDATDRYANVEVNYLLQRIETYDGVVLLTTNYSTNIDSAFERRIDHAIKFKQPRADTREAIWREIFPDDAPTDAIDYAFLATIELTGGQIKSVGQTAAILAAADDAAIGMRHLVRALEREFGTRGNPLFSVEFGEYARHFQSRHAKATHGDGGESDSEGAAGPGESAAVDGQRPPEDVVRRFAELLDAGEDDRAHELYHSRTLLERLSPKERIMLSRRDLAVGEDIERIRDDANRVVLEIDWIVDGETTKRAYELRPDEDADDAWRLFNAPENVIADR